MFAGSAGPLNLLSGRRQTSIDPEQLQSSSRSGSNGDKGNGKDKESHRPDRGGDAEIPLHRCEGKIDCSVQELTPDLDKKDSKPRIH